MVCKRAQIKKIVADFIRRVKLQAKLPVDEVFLFGSYAWGRPTIRSDIDLAVVSSKFKRLSDIRRIEILSDVARHVCPDLDIDIDVVGFTRDELNKGGYFELAGAVREKGRLVYKRAA